MRWNYRQSGFTLLEIVLVLAITAALIAGIFAGQAALLARSNFQQDVEKVKNDLKTLQAQAVTTVNSNPSASAGNSNQQVFGIVALFSSASPNTIQVITLLTAPAGTTLDATTIPPTALSMRSVSYSSGQQSKAIIFTRSPDFIYVVNSPGSSPSTDVLNSLNYFRQNPNFNLALPYHTTCGAADFNLQASSFTNYAACIIVDTQNNDITRVFK